MWTLHEDRAEWRCDRLTAKLDLRHPERGLDSLTLFGGTVPPTGGRSQSLFQIRLAGRDRGACFATDCYVRDRDLVIRYAASSSSSVESQIDWRMMEWPALNAFGVEVIVSVQTDCLHSDPSSSASSSLHADELWSLREDDEFERCDQGPMAATGDSAASPRGAFLFRTRDSSASYLEMIHPSDLSEGVVSTRNVVEAAFCSRYRLFQEPLEKGVIRRGRLRGIFVPHSQDLANALTLYRDFVESAPPLTT